MADLALGNFSSVLQMTFSINAAVSYLHSVRRKAIKALEGDYEQMVIDYPDAAKLPLSKDIRDAKARYIAHVVRVEYWANVLMIVNAVVSFGLLVLAAFYPSMPVGKFSMVILFGYLTIFPVSNGRVFSSLGSLYRRRMSSLLRKFAYELEIAGLSKDGGVRISKLAELYERDSRIIEHGAWYREMFRRLFSGRRSVPLHAESLALLGQMSEITGKSKEHMIGEALAFADLLLRNEDSILVVTNSDGSERQLPVSDILRAAREDRLSEFFSGSRSQDTTSCSS